MVRQRYHFFPTRDIDDQSIMESNWPKGTPGHAQSRECRNLKIYFGSF